MFYRHCYLCSYTANRTLLDFRLFLIFFIASGSVHVGLQLSTSQIHQSSPKLNFNNQIHRWFNVMLQSHWGKLQLQLLQACAMNLWPHCISNTCFKDVKRICHHSINGNKTESVRLAITYNLSVINKWKSQVCCHLSTCSLSSSNWIT